MQPVTRGVEEGACRRDERSFCGSLVTGLLKEPLQVEVTGSVLLAMRCVGQGMQFVLREMGFGFFGLSVNLDYTHIFLSRTHGEGPPYSA